jgi:Lrp/AsnC family transcriptional regulator, leucine-responsive regulatory protein
MALELDDIDVRLLTELQTDADRTNQELARVVGLSPAATLHRIRRLKETGVIRTVAAWLDPTMVGLPLQVFVTATLAQNDPRATRRFIEVVRETPQVVAADWVAGETDVLLRLVARDVAELQAVLTRLATRGGQRLTTLLQLEEIKPFSPLPLTVGPQRPARRRRRSRPAVGDPGSHPASP